MLFLALHRTSIFGSKNHSFLSKRSKNDLYWLVLSKKKQIRKSMIFGQKLWILPSGKSHCLALYKTLFFWSKNYSFFSPEYPKTIFLTWFLQKIQIRKSMIFEQKLWILPYGKSHCLALFKTLFFWSKNYSFFLQNIQKQYFWLDFSKKINKKKYDFWTKIVDSPLWKISLFGTF